MAKMKLSVKALTPDEKKILFAILEKKKTDPKHWSNDFGQLDEATQLKYRESIDPLIIKGYIYLDHKHISEGSRLVSILTSIKLTRAGEKYIELMTKKNF